MKRYYSNYKDLNLLHIIDFIFSLSSLVSINVNNNTVNITDSPHNDINLKNDVSIKFEK